MAPSAQDVAAFLEREGRFFCPKLTANISLRECRDRQTRSERTHKTRGKRVPYFTSSQLNAYCRSGECELGRDNIVKLRRTK